MIAYLKNRLALIINRFKRRNGASFQDRCAKVIMHTCSLQLERGETRELAAVRGSVGPMVLCGGAITTIAYRVFDSEADDVDPSIRQEPWRAFARVTMTLTVERDPEFTVQVLSKTDTELPDGHWVDLEPRDCHKYPGLALIQHLSEYFPLLPRPYTGPVFKPFEVAQ